MSKNTPQNELEPVAASEPQEPEPPEPSAEDIAASEAFRPRFEAILDRRQRAPGPVEDVREAADFERLMAHMRFAVEHANQYGDRSIATKYIAEWLERLATLGERPASAPEFTTVEIGKTVAAVGRVKKQLRDLLGERPAPTSESEEWLDVPGGRVRAPTSGPFTGGAPTSEEGA